MSRPQRQLRNNVACTSFNNIFRNQEYILNSGCQYLPEDIFKKVNKFSSLSCDQVNSLIFVKNEPHESALNKMKQALASQTKMINSNLKFQMREGGWNRQDGIRIIKSQERECEDEQILKDPCFKSDLQKILLS